MRSRRTKRLALIAAGLCLVAAGLLAHGPGKEAGFLPSIPSGRCDLPDIKVWAGFRVQLLIPHEVVGTIIDDRPTWPGLTKTGHIFYRDGRPILHEIKHQHPGRTRVVITALEDVWIQEPSLAVKIAGGGTWQGFGPDYASRHYALSQKDAYRSTVHFSHVKTSPRFVQTIEYRDGDRCLTMYSDSGFSRLLDNPVRSVPWQGAQVFGKGYTLVGTYTDPDEILRRWELSGCAPPRCPWSGGQMYFHGWAGGPGIVVNAAGRTPPPGLNVTAADGYNLLWNPRAMRLLRRGQHIAETIYVAAS